MPIVCVAQKKAPGSFCWGSHCKCITIVITAMEFLFLFIIVILTGILTSSPFRLSQLSVWFCQQLTALPSVELMEEKDDVTVVDVTCNK